MTIIPRFFFIIYLLFIYLFFLEKKNEDIIQRRVFFIQTVILWYEIDWDHWKSTVKRTPYLNQMRESEKINIPLLQVSNRDGQ